LTPCFKADALTLKAGVRHQVSGRRKKLLVFLKPDTCYLRPSLVLLVKTFHSESRALSG
jgi:hypothetical protein